MRVGFYQFQPSFGRPRENAEAVAAAVRQARADLLVAPELATSGYVFASREESAGLAETLPGPSSELLQQACQESGGRVVLGIAEKAADGFFNSAALIGPDGVEGVYRKTHLFGEEKLHFAGGRTGFPVFTVQAGGIQVRLGMLVCFDHFFPEAARSLALGGAQIICHPSNLVLPEYAQLSSRVRSIENRVFWVLANRYGSGRGKSWSSPASPVTAPTARSWSAPRLRRRLEVVEIDPRLADDKRITAATISEDRRPEPYRL
jgi:predicted amidohydrolase